MIYIKPLFAALLLALATTGEAESTRQSRRRVRGSTEETSRLLNPAGGKGGKSKKVYSFTNPKKGEEVCALKETTFLIDGPSTAIPSANTPLPAGFSFQDCNPLFANADKTDFYKCLEAKGVINGPWFFHRDTPGSQFRFTTDNGGTDESPGSVCSKITYARDTTTTPSPFGPFGQPKAEIEYFSEEFFETKLSDFVSFSVDYKVVSREAPLTSSTMYFVNMYVRIDPNSQYFYDCNFVFDIDTTAPTDWTTFRFDLDTIITSGRDRSSPNPPISPTTCASYQGVKTLNDFLTDYPDTVIGVGNGDTETINLVVGQTGDSYKGLEVCWDNAQVTTTTDRFVYDFEPAA